MNARLSPEREAEIREWVEVMGQRKDIRYYGAHQNMTALLAELAAIRAERDAWRDQRNAVFATNERLLVQVDELGQARLHAENEARTAKRAARGELAALRALELGDLDDRVSATCADPGHPTWLRAQDDTRGCPWCRVAELEAERHTTNEALSDAAEQLRRDRDRIAELERPAVEAKRTEIRQSYAELIAAAEETKDYEGAFDVQCRLREREEQWKREDREPVR